MEQNRNLGVTLIRTRNPISRIGKSVQEEFEVVAVNLTPLIGVQAAQHMKIINVNGENFVRNNRIHQKEVELKKAVSVH